MAKVQHNMWVTHYRQAALSIISGSGNWVEVTIPVDGRIALIRPLNRKVL
jgi:hypothetical protein